jgi:hypothetical protein
MYVIIGKIVKRIKMNKEMILMLLKFILKNESVINFKYNGKEENKLKFSGNFFLPDGKEVNVECAPSNKEAFLIKCENVSTRDYNLKNAIGKMLVQLYYNGDYDDIMNAIWELE